MIYRFEDFELDGLRFELRRRGEVLKLEPKVFDVLAFLVRHRDRVVTKDELLSDLWPGEFVSESVLPRCITAARKALGDTRAKPAAIATVHGRGYRFIAPVREGGEPRETDSGTARSTPFVGREDTMARLRTALEGAATGRGQLMLLIGEPGIGKTRTIDELAGEARQRGFRIVGARCHEGEGAPVYWPWVQVLRNCGSASQRDARRNDPGRDATDIGQLLSEHTGASTSPAPAIPGEERFRLFDGVTALLLRLAASQPLLLALDDLHWADEPSLRLLGHLAREMRQAPLLLVGTFRDTELRRHHPLTRLLGELAREPICERLYLKGLGREDIERFLAARTASADPTLVSALLEMTEGNPFFMEEVTRLLESEGRLQAGAEPARWGVLLPQSVREAVGRRLDALSPTCNRVLAVAAVVGREFDVPLVERVLEGLPSGPLVGMQDSAGAAALAAGAAGPTNPAGVAGPTNLAGAAGPTNLAGAAGPTPEGRDDRAAILGAIDEAVNARLLTVESPALGRYAFSHALVRQTLDEELSLPQRHRLHQRVAEALEVQHAADLESHLAEIAQHLFQAAAGSASRKAIAFSQRAGERALRLLAYEDAEMHFGRALQLLDLNPDSGTAEDRALLFLAQADAQSLAGAREHSQESSRRAAALARGLGRADLLARAALIFAQRAESGPLLAEELRQILEEALQALGDHEPALRSRLLSRLAGTPPYQDSIETRTALGHQAVELARESGDRTALFDALAARLWSMLGPDHDEVRIEAAAELIKLAEKTGERERLLIAMEHRARTFFSLGDLAAADREARAYEALATELRQPTYLLFSKWHWAARALCDGRLAEADDLVRECFDFGRRLQHPAARGILIWHVYWSLRLRGDLAHLEDAAPEQLGKYGDLLSMPGGDADKALFELAIDSFSQEYSFSGPFVPSVVAFIHAQMGNESRAREGYERLAANDFADISRDEWWMPSLIHLADLAATFEDEPRCAAIYALLEPFVGHNAANSLLRTYAGSVAHFLGVLAAARSQREVATNHFETAIADNTRLGARPALVVTRREYARLLSRGRRADQRRGAEMWQLALAEAQALDLRGLAVQIRQESIKNP